VAEGFACVWRGEESERFEVEISRRKEAKSKIIELDEAIMQ
jgi:hypothetical protein